MACTWFTTSCKNGPFMEAWYHSLWGNCLIQTISKKLLLLLICQYLYVTSQVILICAYHCTTRRHCRQTYPHPPRRWRTSGGPARRGSCRSRSAAPSSSRPKRISTGNLKSFESVSSVLGHNSIKFRKVFRVRKLIESGFADAPEKGFEKCSENPSKNPSRTPPQIQIRSCTESNWCR